MIGYISEKYESGGKGPGTISTPINDPGGKSYGTYQFSSKSGTLNDYVRHTIFDELRLSILATEEFDNTWEDLATHYPFEFKEDQYAYAFSNIYLPLSRFAKDLNFHTEDARIQEALFSVAIQHGNAKMLIKNVKDVFPIETQLKGLYSEREEYINSLNLSASIKASLATRYRQELRDVLLAS